MGLSEKPRIAIIGGSGFVGQELADELSSCYRVSILDIAEPKFNYSSKIDFRQVDICNYSLLKDCLNDVDFVIHTAIVQIPLINEDKKLGYDVNIKGIQNTCQCVDEIERCKGMILTGTWHIMGESGFNGEVDETFGYRPDHVESRAKLYVISKTAQEMIVRYFSEMTDKFFGIVRLGTVLGKFMPSGTAASIFIKKGLNGGDITPYKHSMHRPMFYVDIRNVRSLFRNIVDLILSGEDHKVPPSSCVNIWYPKPITILELAHAIKNGVKQISQKSACPKLKIVDQGLPTLFTKQKINIKMNVSIAEHILNPVELIAPTISINWIITHYANIEQL